MNNNLFNPMNGTSQLKIALLGNPRVCLDWSAEQLRALADIGFNAVQLNLAWLCRPHDEALNLRDVVTIPGEEENNRVAERRVELQHRSTLAKKFGFRTLFHFGSPFMWRNPYTGEIRRKWLDDNNNRDDQWYDVLNPLVVEHETTLLREFRRQFPEVDDILVYTYDQDAWQVSEFGKSKYSRGIPLHKRIPGYLKALHQVWTEGREDGAIMWWEPWELSAGQIYKCLPELPRRGFGLILHNNIAEVQVAMPVDIWYRNTVRICRKFGIPVVGEGFFCSMTEEIEPLSIPCPRLVDEQFLTMTGVSGIVGIKEYYGVLPLIPDLNLDIFRARLVNPEGSTEELLDIITQRFGNLQRKVLQLLGSLSNAIQVYPWDATWFARLAGLADIDHGWSGATVGRLMVETPSWRSSRCAHFMMTDDRQPHPFVLEDVGLRCELATEDMEKALSICDNLLTELPKGPDQKMFKRIRKDGNKFKRIGKSYALHLKETNVAKMLRDDLKAGRPMMPRLLEEMERLLEADVKNQRYQGYIMDKGRVLQMRELFKKDPESFVRNHLVPTEQTILEKGYFSMTTR